MKLLQVSFTLERVKIFDLTLITVLDIPFKCLQSYGYMYPKSQQPYFDENLLSIFTNNILKNEIKICFK